MEFKRLQEIVKNYKNSYKKPPFKIIDKNCPDLLYYECDKEKYVKLYIRNFIEKLIVWLNKDLEKLEFQKDYHGMDKSKEIKDMNEDIRYLEKKLNKIKRKDELEEKLLEELSDEELENISNEEFKKRLSNMSK